MKITMRNKQGAYLGDYQFDSIEKAQKVIGNDWQDPENIYFEIDDTPYKFEENKLKPAYEVMK